MIGGADPRIAVDILTGFLGSGKTTLLRRLIEAGALAETAILVNEFAGLPVDDRLVGFSGGAAALIGDRCLCCTSDGNLVAALVGLLDAAAMGRIPPFRRILVETSGIADPAALGATLARDPMLRPRLRLGTVVALVDLMHGAATLEDSPEALTQIVAADRILFSKADRAGSGATEALANRLAAINPGAVMLSRGDDAFADLPAATARPRFFSALPVEARHGGIAAGVIRTGEAVEWPRLAAWLSLLMHRHGQSILRIKGVVLVAGASGTTAVVLHAVRHVVHQPEHVSGDTVPGETALVVITRGLPPATVEVSFARYVTGGAIAAPSSQPARAAAAE